ncbi:hypothetical protein [Aureliella helgolandensis]|uniref:Uncharacterized protein n=1 Tax=Aureliella helgolandensis TaxID=2527968 RepID=A0A518GED0_9BACT|nr:hypothetical protein [Aureliella helgolandensis]QDV26955.1 hypothetical protein Q31a_53350 [Aureliella helgolandensis]
MHRNRCSSLRSLLCRQADRTMPSGYVTAQFGDCLRYAPASSLQPYSQEEYEPFYPGDVGRYVDTVSH